MAYLLVYLSFACASKLLRWNHNRESQRWAAGVPHRCSCCWICGRAKCGHNESFGRILHSWCHARPLSVGWFCLCRCPWNSFPPFRVIFLPCVPLRRASVIRWKREELYGSSKRGIAKHQTDNELNKHPTLMLYAHDLPWGRRYIQPTEASYCSTLVSRIFWRFSFFRMKRITLSFLMSAGKRMQRISQHCKCTKKSRTVWWKGCLFLVKIDSKS